jgi:hypothetical protein
VLCIISLVIGLMPFLALLAVFPDTGLAKLYSRPVAPEDELFFTSKLLEGAASSSSATGAAAAAPVVSAEDTSAARIATMTAAGSALSMEAVMVECVAEGSEVRARVISSGYDPSKICQFPHDIREAGKKFWVQTIVDAGSFYRATGTITPV